MRQVGPRITVDYHPGSKLRRVGWHPSLCSCQRDQGYRPPERREQAKNLQQVLRPVRLPVPRISLSMENCVRVP